MTAQEILRQREGLEMMLERDFDVTKGKLQTVVALVNDQLIKLQKLCQHRWDNHEDAVVDGVCQICMAEVE